MTSPATFYSRPGPYGRVLLVVLLMAGWTLLGCQILADSACLGGHTDDATMIQDWQSNHGEFDQVIQMFVADKGLEWLPYEWTDAKDVADSGLDRARLGVYHQHFAHLGIRALYAIPGTRKHLIKVIASFCTYSSDKGYVYAADKTDLPPSIPIINGDLDAYQPPDRKNYAVFRPLSGSVMGGQWYLYYEYDVDPENQNPDENQPPKDGKEFPWQRAYYHPAYPNGYFSPLRLS